jgi:hypothetical protein
VAPKAKTLSLKAAMRVVLRPGVSILHSIQEGSRQPTADSWNDRNLRFRANATHKAARQLNIHVPDENIYVLSNLSLLSCNAISKTGVARPKR